jgi:hypothetical protein
VTAPGERATRLAALAPDRIQRPGNRDLSDQAKQLDAAAFQPGDVLLGRQVGHANLKSEFSD